MLTTYKPSQTLSNYVLHYFVLDWQNTAEGTSIRQLSLPTGCSFMGFHLQGRLKIEIDNHYVESKKFYVNAQATKPYFLIAERNLFIIVACLKPTALYHFFGIDLQPLVNRDGDIYSLLGEKLNELEIKLAKTTDINQRVQLLESVLLAQLSESTSQLNFIDMAVDIIIENKGCISVTKLTDRLRVSQRYFQRIFKKMVGICPSIYINIIRYNFIFAYLKNNRIGDCKTVSALFNFYDVPHFSKHFKSLFGRSPSKFDINAHPLLKLSAVENSLWLFSFKNSPK